MGVKKGDKIRILQDRLSGANVLKGDVLEVTGRISWTVFIAESPRQPGAQGWWFDDELQGEGWELVHNGGS